MVISHDRYLIERICDSVWALFGDGQLTNLPRGIDEYLERRRAAGAAGDPGKVARTASAAAPSGSARAADRGPGDAGGSASAGSAVSGSGPGSAASGSGSAAPAAGSGEHREMQKEMNRLERQMDKLSTREDKLHGDLAAAAGDSPDTEKLAALDRELKEVVAEKSQLEERWLELGELLEG